MFRFLIIIFLNRNLFFSFRSTENRKRKERKNWNIRLSGKIKKVPWKQVQKKNNIMNERISLKLSLYARLEMNFSFHLNVCSFCLFCVCCLSTFKPMKKFINEIKHRISHGRDMDRNEGEENIENWEKQKLWDTNKKKVNEIEWTLNGITFRYQIFQHISKYWIKRGKVKKKKRKMLEEKAEKIRNKWNKLTSVHITSTFSFAFQTFQFFFLVFFFLLLAYLLSLLIAK